MSVHEARAAIVRKETSALELVSSFLSKIERDNTRYNAFLSVDEAGARVAAAAVDRAVAAGDAPPLAGLVLGVKDVICIQNGPVTCGSRILEGFTSLFDATVIRRLKDAGAVVVGKTNCDQFAMGSSNESSYFGPVRNPLNRDLVPGGSSGGSAAAVAAGFCSAALGSDTGGSIRQPAAFCGVVGLKPTYGRVSRYGLVAYASSFDTIGPLTTSVHDAALILNVIAGQDPSDATSAPVPVPDYTANLDAGVRGLRIGLPSEYFAEGLEEGIRAVIMDQVARLERAGASIVPVKLPTTAYGIATYYILTMAEASSNLARFDGVRYGYRADMRDIRRRADQERKALDAAIAGAERAGDPAEVAALRSRRDEQRSLLQELYTRTRSEGFGEEVKRRIMLGTYVLSSGYYDAYYAKAQQVRTLIRRDFDAAFEQVDALLTPATPTLPFPLGSKTDDPLAMYLQDVYTVTANLAGIPGLVVPLAGHPSGLPVGLQLLGRHFEESTLLRVGQAVSHSSTDFH
ncbi:MAG: amidase family protein [Rhodothermales bacterium]|nr:amidase family protein [Rhodothermales bacterium]